MLALILSHILTERSTMKRFPDPRLINRRDLRRLLDRCWREAWHDYHAAGAPFGLTERGLELWIEYEQRTTVN